MPANLPAEWYKIKNKYEDSETKKEKIKNLKELISATPKHKGTEKIRSDLNKKLSRLKKESEKKVTTSKTYTIKKYGDAQISIVGPPNSGKSTILRKLTNAKPEIADYNYTTTKPEVGMFKYKGLNFQLVEIPSTFTPEMLSIARNSDLILILPGTDKEVIRNFDGNNVCFLRNNQNMETDIGKKIFDELGIIRVFTKMPDKDTEKKPVALKKDSNVRDFAKSIHRDFIEKFKFAKIFGPSAKFDGEKVGLEHKLKDRDVVEIHISI